MGMSSSLSGLLETTDPLSQPTVLWTFLIIRSEIVHVPVVHLFYKKTHFSSLYFVCYNCTVYCIAENGPRPHTVGARLRGQSVKHIYKGRLWQWRRQCWPGVATSICKTSQWKCHAWGWSLRVLWRGSVHRSIEVQDICLYNNISQQDLIIYPWFNVYCSEAHFSYEVVRRRELKWIDMFENWEKWNSKRFKKVWYHMNMDNTLFESRWNGYLTFFADKRKVSQRYSVLTALQSLAVFISE